MGGHGSGNNFPRLDKRETTCDYPILDSFVYNKRISLLRQRNRECLSGTINDPIVGKISIRLFENHVVLSFNYGSGDKQKKAKCEIKFSGVSNNYGGNDRTYFLCPDCERRCRFLYLIMPRFKCRVCAKLNYEIQQTGSSVYLAARNVLRFSSYKLNSGLPSTEHKDIAAYTPPRPKGMHRATYDRLLVELRGLQSEYIRQHNKRLDKAYSKHIR